MIRRGQPCFEPDQPVTTVGSLDQFIQYKKRYTGGNDYGFLLSHIGNFIQRKDSLYDIYIPVKAFSWGACMFSHAARFR